MKPRHLTASLIALAAVGIPVAGCGGSSSSSASASAASSPQPTAPSGSQQSKASSSPQSKPSGGSGSLTIANFAFAPARLTVGPGTRITIANHDSTAHTVTADNGKSFDTDSIDAGATATVTLSKPGTYKYHCSIHPFMHGTFVVR